MHTPMPASCPLRNRCSYKADEGYLYPLEKAFFYIMKPPMLIAHDEIESMEFQRQASGVLGSTIKTFDLVIRCAPQPLRVRCKICTHAGPSA